MRKVRYFLSNINLINIVLALLLILLVNYMALPFLRMNTALTLPRVKKPAIEKVTAGEKTTEEKSPSPSDYTVIAEQNLFHPERTIPVAKADAGPIQPLPQPEFVLYGTLVTDELKVAYMEDKKAKEPQGTRKKQTALRLGERMSGFILVEVDDDKVLMKRAGEEAIVVSLNEPKVREVPVPVAAEPAKTAVTSPGRAAAAVSSAKTVNRGTAKAAARDQRRELRERARAQQRGRMTFGGFRSLKEPK
jgi:hypothetical protein